MDLERFWELIEKSRHDYRLTEADGNIDRQINALTVQLQSLAAEEVLAFDQQFHALSIAAYRWDLWAAAYIIEGGCSDDGFWDFRTWLISMGQKVYEGALADPDALVDIADAPGVECTQAEGLQYVGQKVYEKLSGQEMPVAAAYPDSPEGERWEEDGLAKLAPKLFDKFW